VPKAGIIKRDEQYFRPFQLACQRASIKFFRYTARDESGRPAPGFFKLQTGSRQHQQHGSPYLAGRHLKEHQRSAAPLSVQESGPVHTQEELDAIADGLH
jgi:hypothetical protein